MADEIDVLLSRVEDEGLRQELAAQVGRLKQRRRFGLVFEEHLPESVVLSQYRIRRGTKVVFREDPSGPPSVVTSISGSSATIADGIDTFEVEVADLVAVAEFGEPIFPGLKPLGAIERGGEKPAHLVIKGENYHALEALQFTHAGAVDCIYIDPPYNTGARDWKYNNDYVDGDDSYRHSKWLAFMQRRLVVAKQLLDPQDSVLIVTIDEKEYLRLGMLLEQVFPEARIQMVTSVISQKGSARQDEFSRCDEFIFFVMLGASAPQPQLTDMLNSRTTEKGDEVEWGRLTRNGANGRRTARPNLHYPVFFDQSGNFHSVGDSMPPDAKRSSVVVPDGLTAVFPTATNGTEMSWALSPDKFREYVPQGFVKFGSLRPEAPQPVRIYYLTSGYVDAARRGEILRSPGKTLKWLHSKPKGTKPLTVWNKGSHNASEGGTNLLKRLLPDRRFPFPKSLYAVEDALRFFVGDKPSAVVVDFFAGSGTTTHAVARLNRQDGGNRQSIIVTNNEVSDAAARRMSSEGLQPGDEKWEAEGIFEFITKPRVEAAFKGETSLGKEIDGKYRFTDEFPISEGFQENAVFVELEYLEAEAVSLDRAFGAIAPLLWLRAGGTGPVLGRPSGLPGAEEPFAVSESYGVLFNPDRWRTFVESLAPSVSHAFIVTDSASEFTNTAAALPNGVEAIRLYENYLSTFTINTGASL